jgi:hypothetical protein
MDRLSANRKLVQIISEAIEEYPDVRFGQVLTALRIVTHTRPVSQETADNHQLEWKDEFYLESSELLERVENSLKSAHDE